MSELRPPTALQWWSWFKKAVTIASGDDESLLTKCEQRVAERPISEGFNKEWTTVMSLFLSDIAYHKRFHQRWEVGEMPKKKSLGKIDFAWYPYERSHAVFWKRPSVLIEHEQQRYAEKEKGLKWAAEKLMKSYKKVEPPPLRVLITYRWNRPRKPFVDEDLKELVQKGLGSAKFVPLLLVIGADDHDKIEEWHGYIWGGPSDGFPDTPRVCHVPLAEGVVDGIRIPHIDVRCCDTKSCYDRKGGR